MLQKKISDLTTRNTALKNNIKKYRENIQKLEQEIEINEYIIEALKEKNEN